MEFPQRPFLALGLRLASIMFAAAMMAMVKYAGESGVSIPEIIFWRQVVTVPILLGYMAMTGGFEALRTQRMATHGRRAVLSTVNMVFNFGAAILLPLAEATVLGFTSPLFAVILAATFMRQPVGLHRWLAVAFGLIGVIIIAQPGGAPIHPLGMTFGLIAAVLIALINYQIRDLARTENPITMVFYFSAFGALISGVFMPFYMTAHTGWQWTILIATGVVGTAAQLLVSASLRFGAVTSVIVMDYTLLIWATLYGWLIWRHLPPASTWIGAPLIVAAAIIIAWREHRLRQMAIAEEVLD